MTVPLRCPTGGILRVRFAVVSDFKPSGDQPTAIDDLERRVRRGDRHTVLMGATGTGKSATTAWLVERLPRMIGGRYGLSSKEFTPSMARAVYDELAKEAPKNHFTIGINDDVGFTSIEYDHDFVLEPGKTGLSP